MTEMTHEEFDLSTSSRPGDTTRAARDVLVCGMTVADATKKYSIKLEASVKNEMSRVRAKHARIIAAFRPRIAAMIAGRLRDAADKIVAAAEKKNSILIVHTADVLFAAATEILNAPAQIAPADRRCRNTTADPTSENIAMALTTKRILK